MMAASKAKVVMKTEVILLAGHIAITVDEHECVCVSISGLSKSCVWLDGNVCINVPTESPRLLLKSETQLFQKILLSLFSSS